MFNEKEYDLEKEELQLIQKGADILNVSITAEERLEIRVNELETKIHELERRFNKHINTEGAHNI